jgi:hypothetical protein
MKKNKIISSILIATLFLLFGCNEAIHSPESYSNTPVIQNSPTLIRVTETIQVTVTPSKTPMQTLSPEDAQTEISNMMKMNGNCLGFCFWGITPGSSSFYDSVVYLETIKQSKTDSDNEGNLRYSTLLLYSNENMHIAITFSSINGTVGYFHARVNGLDNPNIANEQWAAFRPDNFLIANGVPKNIYLIISEGQNGRLGYELIFLFDKGYIQYDSINKIYSNQQIINACPNKPYNSESFDFVSLPNPDSVLDQPGIVNITDVNGMTAEDIFNLLTSNKSTGCFVLDYDKYLSHAD